MKVFIKGQSRSISLTKQDFIAKGGEGQIYGRRRIVYKIYLDKRKMIPEAKIIELGVLESENILGPKAILLDKKKSPIGFTMDWIKNSEALCKLFTNGFRDRKNITNDTIIKLIEKMVKVIRYIHSKNFLIVDGNEFNYLVDDNSFSIPYFIDVDSYQTPSFPATAIMPSIRDPHCGGSFSELSDWYSFAIVACQLFIGIHPFKGRHPSYSKKDIEGRMRANISVFNSEVSVPPSTRSFDLIPENYKAWLIDLFENRNRVPPPDIAGALTIIAAVSEIIIGTDKFDISMLKEFDDDILYHRAGLVGTIVKTKNWSESNTNKLYVNNKEFTISIKVEVLYTPGRQIPVLVDIEDDKLLLKSLDNNVSVEHLNIACTEFMIIEDALFVRYQDNFVEIFMDERKGRISPVVKLPVWNILPQASTIFSGVVYQDVLGKPFVLIPIPKVGEDTSCAIVSLPELEGYVLIEAKHTSGVLFVIGHKSGKYKRFIFLFDKGYRGYKCREFDDIDYKTINFVVLPNGLVVTIYDDDIMEIFSSDPTKTKIKRIDSSDIDSSLRLSNYGSNVLFFKDNRLYTLKMKN